MPMYFLFACFIALSSLFFPVPGKALVVVIDAGHGGKDSGTFRPGLPESKVVLKLSLALDQLLTKDPRFKSILTRKTDVFLSLKERVTKALNAQADILLSIHVNSSPDPRQRGADFYFQNQLPPDEEALYLAAKENQAFEERDIITPDQKIKQSDSAYILDDLHRQHSALQSYRLAKSFAQNWNIGDIPPLIRQAPFFLVNHLNVPSVLIEVGYMTNDKDAESFSNEETLQKMAEGLYGGLVHFKEFLDKATSRHL